MIILYVLFYFLMAVIVAAFAVGMILTALLVITELIDLWGKRK